MTALRKFIRRTALLALLLTLAGLALVALVSFYSNRSLYDSSAWVDHTHRVLRQLTELRTALAEAETNARGYLLTGDRAFLGPYRAAAASASEHVNEVAALTVDNPRQQERVPQLRALLEERLRTLEASVAARATGAGAGKLRAEVERGQESTDVLTRLIGDMEADEEQLLAARSATTAANYRHATAAFAAAALLAAAVLVGVYVLIRRDLAARQREEDRARESERFTRMILDSTNEGIYGVDTSGVCTFMNAAGCRLLGYEASELVGRAVHGIFHHSRADGTAYPAEDCPILRAARDGQRLSIEDVLWRKNGEPFPVSYTTAPILDDGRNLGAVVTFADLSDRRRAEAHALEQQEQFHTMVNAIPQLAWIAEAIGEVSWFNRRWYEYTGTAPDEMKGGGWSKVVHPDHVDRVTSRLAAAFAAGEEWEDTFPLRSKTGEYRGFLSRAMPIRNAGGKVVRWFGTNTDIEDQQRAERELAEARDAAEAANQAKSTFLANMSHELRTPLNAVILYSELLQEEAEDRGINDFLPDLEKIRAAGRHLLGLVNNILDLSKIEAGRMELYIERFDLADLLRDVTTTIQPLLDKRGNVLKTDVAEPLGTMQADLTKVRQILFNLLSNASKFTEHGTIRLAGQRRRKGDREGIEFSVADTGIGMTPEQLGKLFQPFTQADASTTRKYGGTGLGLTIVKRFCEMMGGRIELASEAGKGTTFTVWLPAVVGPIKSEAPDGAAAAAAAGTAEGPDVLVIDDEPTARDLLTRVLTREGFRVRTAADGPAGLKAAATAHPDIIVLDVSMPTMDGWAVLAALKADRELADIPVVIHSMIDNKGLGFALGAAEYLTKPVDRDRLITVLNRFTGAGAAGPVLVVEDDDDTRQAIGRALTSHGWPVAEAVNGRIGLEKMSAAKPAIVLLDLMMPEMNGFEFLAEVRKRPEWDDVPIVIVTAKELTAGDRDQLEGQVRQIVQKGQSRAEDMVREVRRLVAACARRPMTPTAARNGPPANGRTQQLEASRATHSDRRG
jgi:PAS domain S-box-containing protein